MASGNNYLQKQLRCEAHRKNGAATLASRSEALIPSTQQSSSPVNVLLPFVDGLDQPVVQHLRVDFVLRSPWCRLQENQRMRCSTEEENVTDTFESTAEKRWATLVSQVLVLVWRGRTAVASPVRIMPPTSHNDT